ncbi:bifunctional ADP-dependent NAD(P)H-hydrate dehydratase/NAD(P)H-hydrate epimerase [Corynebacterium sp. 335C]
MHPVYAAEEIRAGERPLLEAQTHDDELMLQAAAAVAGVAREMLADRPGEGRAGRVLVLAGSGGNGGDALYAAASLLADGHRAEAVLLGSTAHAAALASFEDAGGVVVDAARGLGGDVHDLAIDGITGIGGAGGLRPEAAGLVAQLAAAGVPVLAVDVPSGVAADSGAADGPHVEADRTVTFGGLRRAHVLAPECGRVTLVDIGLPGHGPAPLSEQLRRLDRDVRVGYVRALHSVIDLPSLEPGARDDKYTGGVAGICAGGADYPGAAVLAATGAVRATSAMVRYAGSCRAEVVRALPEVVAHDDAASAGRVQAWACGPGRGTGDAEAAEVAELAGRAEPLVLDADALTLLSEREDLRDAVAARGARGARTVLTPHRGEFARLAGSLGGAVPDAAGDPVAAVVAMARTLRATVLLKGRVTLVAAPAAGTGDGAGDGSGGAGIAADAPVTVTAVDAETSWAATPGSGDVLTGVIAAWLARAEAAGDASSVTPRGTDPVVVAAVIHARAAEIAARTPAGHAPASASLIADAVREATAAAAGGLRAGEAGQAGQAGGANGGAALPAGA